VFNHIPYISVYFVCNNNIKMVALMDFLRRSVASTMQELGVLIPNARHSWSNTIEGVKCPLNTIPVVNEEEVSTSVINV